MGMHNHGHCHCPQCDPVGREARDWIVWQVALLFFLFQAAIMAAVIWFD